MTNNKPLRSYKTIDVQLSKRRKSAYSGLISVFGHGVVWVSFLGCIIAMFGIWRKMGLCLPTLRRAASWGFRV